MKPMTRFKIAVLFSVIGWIGRWGLHVALMIMAVKYLIKDEIQIFMMCIIAAILNSIHKEIVNNRNKE